MEYWKWLTFPVAFLYLVMASCIKSFTNISPRPHGTITLVEPKQTVTFIMTHSHHQCLVLDLLMFSTLFNRWAMNYDTVPLTNQNQYAVLVFMISLWNDLL